MSELFDVIVIGGGPGGYLAAERCAQGGLKTAIFEERALGGTCLNEGCIPTKTILNSAKLYNHARFSEGYGVHSENVTLDHEKVIERRHNVTKTLVAGVGAQMRANKIKVVKQHGNIAGKTADGFKVCDADGNEYEGRNLILATGSETFIPGIPGLKEGLDSGFVITSREALSMTEIPKSMAVIGAGSIGLEMATYYSSAGTDITVIEMLDKVAGSTDREISEFVQKDMEKHGVKFSLSSKVTAITGNAVEFECNGEKKSIETDKVLLAIGRRPVVANCGLETIGVYVENGAVAVDDNMRTNVPGVYAIGDANGKVMLAHAAYRGGEVAANTILGKHDIFRYDAVPTMVFSFQDAASVGESEESAKEKGIDFAVKKVSMLYSGRFVAEYDNNDGICKILVEKKTGRVIGVHIFGAGCSESIWGASVMIESHWKLDDFKEIVFPHPTVSEIVREAMFV